MKKRRKTDVMSRLTIAAFRCCNPIVQLILNSNLANPFLPSFQACVTQLFLVRVELDWIRIQTINFDSATHRPEVHNRLYFPNHRRTCRHSINQTNTLHLKLIAIASIHTRCQLISMNKRGSPVVAQRATIKGIRYKNGIDKIESNGR